MKKGIVFDMDGVLFDTERISLKSFRIVGKEINLTEYNVDEIAADCIGLNVTDMKILFQEKYPKLDYESFWPRIKYHFQALLEQELPLKPGVEEILAYLHENGWTVGLASSSVLKNVTGHLKRSGFEKYFQVVIGGDMVEHSKPKPDIYLKACALLDIDPRESYAIEDSFNGIKSAYAAGMKTIMVPDLLQPTEELLPKVYQKLNSLMELKEYFEKNKI